MKARREVCNFIKAMAYDRKGVFAPNQTWAPFLAFRKMPRNPVREKLRRSYKRFRKGWEIRG